MVNLNVNGGFLCLIGYMFLAGSIYTILTCTECPPFKLYEESLSPTLKDTYNKVKLERNTIYIQGLFLGTVLATVITYLSRGTFDIIGNSCVFTGIATLVQYFYYILVPKSVNMLPLLENQEQVKLWHQVYKEMQYRYHLGMIIGFVGYFALTYGSQRLFS